MAEHMFFNVSSEETKAFLPNREKHSFQMNSLISSLQKGQRNQCDLGENKTSVSHLEYNDSDVKNN